MATQTKQDKKFTIRESAEYIHMSGKFTYATVYSGKIPHYRLGRSIRIKQSDLDAFLERGYQPAAE